MTDKQNKPVRSHDDQVSELCGDLRASLTALESKITVELSEAEDRGAAEQRRKDAKERDRAISHLRQLVKSYRACGWFRTSKAISRTLKSAYGVHYGPGEWERELPDSIQSINMMGPGTVHALIANVAALEEDAMRYRIVRQRFLEDARNQGDDLTADSFDAKVDGDMEARAALTREGGV